MNKINDIKIKAVIVKYNGDEPKPFEIYGDYSNGKREFLQSFDDAFSVFQAARKIAKESFASLLFHDSFIKRPR